MSLKKCNENKVIILNIRIFVLISIKVSKFRIIDA